MKGALWTPLLLLFVEVRRIPEDSLGLCYIQYIKPFRGYNHKKTRFLYNSWCIGQGFWLQSDNIALVNLSGREFTQRISSDSKPWKTWPKRLRWTTRAGRRSEDPAIRTIHSGPTSSTADSSHWSQLHRVLPPHTLLAMLPDFNAATAPILLTDYKGHVFLMYNILNARV